MGFKLLSTIATEVDIKVDKYVSEETGLKVVLADIEGPLVNGYFGLATEAHDCDGLPHTLEHLIFLGSEDYPYRGVLDILATRCLAGGTNALTDIDNTMYTLSTASDEGFRNLLPIYLDHILYPLLTDSGFVTEVHHVNENGEDSGVVYCEMQGVENSSHNLCYVALGRHMYPGKCGYKSVTGGVMKNLRETTNNEKIRNYHTEFYRSENLVLVITGKFDKANMLATIMEYEKKIIRKNNEQKDRKPMIRPWSSPVPPLSTTVRETVLYPADDNSTGLVLIGWRGPSAVNDYKTVIALNTLVEYLNDTAIAPLQKEFVECSDPFCSSIEFCITENSECCLELGFQSVPERKLTQIEGKLFQLFSAIVSGTEAFDIKRMKSVIHRNKLRILSQFETAPHFLVSSAAIGDFLYGNSEADFNVRLNKIPTLDELNTKNAQYWISLLQNWFLNGKYVCIIGEPNTDLAKQLADEEKLRYQNRREELGESGLNQLKDKLTAAKEFNGKPVPIEAINIIPFVNADRLNYHSIERYSNCYFNKINDKLKEFKQLPIRCHIDDVKTNFITLRAIANTDCLSIEDRLYLPLYTEVVLETAVQRGEKLIPYEEVVEQLADDTVSNNVAVGIQHGRQYSQLITYRLKIEVDKYFKAIQWLKEIIYQTVFTEKRLKIVVTRMLNELNQTKRDGFTVTDNLITSLCFRKNSNYWAKSLYQQQKFLTDLFEQLNDSPTTVIERLNEIRTKISSRDKLTLHLTMNLDKVMLATGNNVLRPWIDHFSSLSKTLPTEPGNIRIEKCSSFVEHTKQRPSNIIVGNGSVESSYMCQVYDSIDSHLNADYPALLVLLKYLEQEEGPLWKSVRITGLSYGYGLRVNVDEGLVYFSLYSSTHPGSAYQQTINVIKDFMSADYKWDESMLISSRCGVIYELVSNEKNIDLLSIQSLVHYIRDLDINWKKELISKISKVTLNDIKNIAAKYLSTFLNNEQTRSVICCHPSKVDEIVSKFNSMGKKMTVINVEKDNFMTDLM